MSNNYPPCGCTPTTNSVCGTTPELTEDQLDQGQCSPYRQVITCAKDTSVLDVAAIAELTVDTDTESITWTEDAPII